MQALNRLRVGEHTPADEQYFLSQGAPGPVNISTTPHIFFTNKDVNAHNLAHLEALDGDLLCIAAHDDVLGPNQSDKFRANILGRMRILTAKEVSMVRMLVVLCATPLTTGNST